MFAENYNTMIQANELRIGNWIADRGLKTWQIDHWETINKVSSKANATMCSGTLMETHPLTEYIDYLKPIPLTEEWLVKFGFEKRSAYYTKHPLSIKTQGKYFFYKTIIKYVHQLQNLYFALTGEELTINN